MTRTPRARDRLTQSGYDFVLTEHAQRRVERWRIDPLVVERCMRESEPVLARFQEEWSEPKEEKWDTYYEYSKKYRLRVVYVLSEEHEHVRIITVHKIDIKRQAGIAEG